MTRILLLVIALIVYGSLYPWDFSRQPGADPIAALIANWPRLTRFALRDFGINILLYVPLGAAAFLSFVRRLRPAVAMASAAALGIALSAAVEVTQTFVPQRTPSAFDIFCNTLGTVAGVLLAAGFRPRFERAAAVRQSRGTAVPSAFALLFVWMAYQLYPLFPALSLHLLMRRLRFLAVPGWTWSDAFAAAADWTAAAVLADAVFGPRLGRSRFLLMLAAVPFRLVIAGRGPGPADFIGAAAALVLSFVLPRNAAVRTRAAAAILSASILFRELAPFHFSSHSKSFTWIPFGGSLESIWVSAVPILIRKAYVYGAALWLIRATGLRLRTAAAGLVLSLAAFEALQTRLPGRTPEITDPLLALLIALALGWLGRAERPRQSCDRIRVR